MFLRTKEHKQYPGTSIYTNQIIEAEIAGAYVGHKMLNGSFQIEG